MEARKAVAAARASTLYDLITQEVRESGGMVAERMLEYGKLMGWVGSALVGSENINPHVYDYFEKAGARWQPSFFESNQDLLGNNEVPTTPKFIYVPVFKFSSGALGVDLVGADLGNKSVQTQGAAWFMMELFLDKGREILIRHLFPRATEETQYTTKNVVEICAIPGLLIHWHDPQFLMGSCLGSYGKPWAAMFNEAIAVALDFPEGKSLDDLWAKMKKKGEEIKVTSESSREARLKTAIKHTEEHFNQYEIYKAVVAASERDKRSWNESLKAASVEGLITSAKLYPNGFLSIGFPKMKFSEGDAEYEFNECWLWVHKDKPAIPVFLTGPDNNHGPIHHPHAGQGCIGHSVDNTVTLNANLLETLFYTSPYEYIRWLRGYLLSSNTERSYKPLSQYRCCKKIS